MEGESKAELIEGKNGSVSGRSVLWIFTGYFVFPPNLYTYIYI